MSETEEQQPKRLGPRGGDLDIATLNSKPEWRESTHNGQTLPSGHLGPHRFEHHETATAGRKNEQPWHTMAAYMVNAGRTNSEIAMAAGVSVPAVSAVRAQRWFQERCSIIANQVGEEILGAIKSYALEAVEGIHDIATDPETSARVRLSAYTTLLEQGHGKPVQKVMSEISHSVSRSPSEEMQEIQRELSALRSKPAAAIQV